MNQFRTLHDIAKAARANLSRNNWDYLIGAADTETSLKRNRLALDSLAFRPRVLNDVVERRCERRPLAAIVCAYRWCCRRSVRFRVRIGRRRRRLRKRPMRSAR